MCTLDKIIYLMKENGIKQKEICKALGFSKQTFTNWKLGYSESYKKHLPEIAGYLGVSVDYLLGNTSNKQISDYTDYYVLLGKKDEYTMEMWEEIKDFAEFLKNKKAKIT